LRLVRILKNMKKPTIILILLTIGLFSCSHKKKVITINGKTNLNHSEKVEYIFPIDGKWFYGDKKTIMTDSAGTFQIKMHVEKASFVTMYVSGKAGTLLIEPNKTYDVNFEFKQNQKKIDVTSRDSIGQNFYNKLPTPDFDIRNSHNFLQDSIPAEISSKINALKDEELSKFNQLLEKGEISKDFYELAILDRKCYYLALEIGVATNMLFQNYNNKIVNSVNEYWNQKIEDLELNEFEYIRSPWFYVLAKNFIAYNQILSSDFDLQLLREKYNNGEIYKYNISEAEKYFKGEQLEYYLASYIFYESWQTKDNSKEIIEIYNDFEKEYPKSVFTKYLTASVQPIIEYQNEIADSSKNYNIQVIENYASINTFDELIEILKGKKMLVDVLGYLVWPM